MDALPSRVDFCQASLIPIVPQQPARDLARLKLDPEVTQPWLGPLRPYLQLETTALIETVCFARGRLENHFVMIDYPRVREPPVQPTVPAPIVKSHPGPK